MSLINVPIIINSLRNDRLTCLDKLRENDVHDSFSLLQELQLHSHDQYVNNLCVYGDPAYPLRQLQVQFHGAVLIKQEEA